MIRRWTMLFSFLLVLCASSHAVSDSAPFNNLKNVTVTVIAMPDISVVFVPYVNSSNDDVSNFTTLATNQQSFFKQIYPLPDSTQTILLQSPYITRMHPWLPNCSAPLELSKNIVLSGQSPTRIVGVASRSLYSGNGYTCFNLKGVISGIDPILTTTAAHEIAHTFDFCDEYSESEWNKQDVSLRSRNIDCLNGDGDNNNIFDDRCKAAIGGQTTCPVESQQSMAEIFFNSLNLSNVSNIMGSRFGSTAAPFRRWVNNETYVKMISQLNRSINNISKQMIVISASANITYSVNAKNFYVIQTLFESSQEDFIVGNLSIATQDSSGRILSRVYIDPRTILFGDDGNTTEFNSTEVLISLPFENVSSIIFTNNLTNTTMNQRTVTPNVPITTMSVNVVQSMIQRGKDLSITWNSTDLDGDPIFFTVLINDGNSSIYSSISSEINETNFTYNSSLLPEAAYYTIKILSTDGVNTNTTHSTNFSIRNAPTIINLTNLSSNLGVYEFKINASSIFNFSNVSWTLRAGKNLSINNTIPFNLTSGTNVRVFVEFNSTNDTVTEANVTVTSENLTGFAYLRFPHGVLSVENFTQLSSSGSMKVFEVIARNTGDAGITGVNWTFNTGDNQGTQTINSVIPFNLSSNQTIRMYLEYNYTNASATHEVTMILNSSQSNVQSAVNVSFASSGLSITNFSVLGQFKFNATFEMIVQNTGGSRDSNSWTLNTGDGTIQSLTGYNLSSNQTIYIFIEHNYSRFGQFSPISSVNSDEDTKTASLNISEFMISNLSSLVESGLNRTFEFFIVNLWGPTLAANWTLNTGIENTSSAYSISTNNSKNVTVYFQYDYPSLQNRTITATVYTNQSNHTQAINI